MKLLKNIKCGDQKGFTLVELAIVMIIIGVLLGGVLKGQEMITNSRVTSTASQLQSIQAAYNAFTDRYSVKPGDMIDAVDRIPRCSAACRAGTAGGQVNGDQEIGGAVGSASASNSEFVAFWGQLASAEFISGITGLSATSEVGVTNPATPLPGGVFKVGDATNGAVNAASGFIGTVISRKPYVTVSGVLQQSTANTGILSPLQAATIDRKLDDGNPRTGTVVGQTLAASCVEAANGTEYFEITTINTCEIAYRM